MIILIRLLSLTHHSFIHSFTHSLTHSLPIIPPLCSTRFSPLQAQLPPQANCSSDLQGRRRLADSHARTMVLILKQPWFFPVTCLIVLLLYLHLFRSVLMMEQGSQSGGSEKIFSSDIKQYLSNEVKAQLLQGSIKTDGGVFSAPVVVSSIPLKQRKRIAVTGGAGFVGSHLVDRLMLQGHYVIVIDNMFTGRPQNIQQWIGHPNFQLILHDVVDPIMLEVDQIYHLACPASPPHYQYNPIKTIKTSTEGTLNMLGLAKRVRARILLTSTSEVYGDPKVHPQPESYWGNVNPIGPRACYDEGKRVAETMMYAYEKQSNVEVRVARIFNTFGPRMHPNDGRVVSNFIIQALQSKAITIYGSGSQTRSFQFVDDLVNGMKRAVFCVYTTKSVLLLPFVGLIALMNGDYSQPVNLGNPDEYSVKVCYVRFTLLT
jgi:UDP-glucuronate decarboxylase